MLKELAVGIESLSEKDDVKVVVLDSALDMFCGGIEIREYTAERVFQVLDAFHRIFIAMLDTGKPVITVINGKAIGGGCELAAFGDLVIATPKAVFAQPEIKLGVFPPLATTIFPFIVGPKLASNSFLRAKPFLPTALANWAWSTDWWPRTNSKKQ
jgi:cyclohexa-1,5-dienecarbonyl-CoA hydratase